jgi:hypothetical protein
MSRSLVVLVLLLAGVVGLGFYLGWFHLATESTARQTNITVTVDRDKIQEDKDRAQEKVQEAGRKLKEKTGARSE